MISNMLAPAPAGVFGIGVVVARPRSCATALAPVAAAFAGLQETRVPVAGLARRRGAELAGIGVVPTTQQHDPISTDDGTTPLGIHSPGRPTS